ncbi:MAG: hypothetical protein PVJ04_02005 [Gemmatimonadota bacterium]
MSIRPATDALVGIPSRVHTLGGAHLVKRAMTFFSEKDESA